MRETTKSMFILRLYQLRYYFFAGLILLGYVFNLWTDLMEIDAAQYAEISREMSESGNYLQVYFQGRDYLDKPPLLFWISSVGISLLGNTTIAYKLFPVLLLMIALYATYRYAALWYDQRIGWMAALILGTTQAFVLMSNDVRTDGLLTTFSILAVWQLSAFLLHRRVSSLILGGLCIGGAMLAKGPIGLCIPAAAIGGHLLLTKQWKKIIHPSWLLLLPVIALVLAPMCYGLYTQFDLHPEKEVYGLKGPSGLRFYFWTQSFGRITGESLWNNNSPWFYFFQTILWDMQPWLLLFIPALWYKIRSLFKGGIKNTNAEWISLCGFVIPFVALSLSGYKLPHYIFPLFPFAAVMMAAWLAAKASVLPRWFEFTQLGLVILMALTAVLMMVWVFPIRNVILPVIWLLLFLGIWFWRKNAADAYERWIFPVLSGALAFQFILALHFYPQLLKYQSGSQVGKFIEQENPDRVYWHDEYDFAMDYYADRIVPNIYGPPMDTLPAGTWIYATEKALPSLPLHRQVKVFDHFPPARLNIKFLNPATRPEKLQRMYLVEISH